MSSVSTSVPIPPGGDASAGLLLLVPLAIPVGAAAASAYSGYKALEKLRSDYHGAIEELETRGKKRLEQLRAGQERERSLEEQASELASGASLGGLSTVGADLANRIKRLHQELDHSEEFPDLFRQSQELLNQARTNDATWEDIYSRYLHLCRELRRERIRQLHASPSETKEAITLLEQMVTSLESQMNLEEFRRVEYDGLRSTIQSGIESTRTLSQTQPKMAVMQASRLQDHVDCEWKTARLRTAYRDEIEGLLLEARARLVSVDAQTGQPELQSAAKLELERVIQFDDVPVPKRRTEAVRICEEAHRLFQKCQIQAELQLAGEYYREELTDTLRDLGYRIEDPLDPASEGELPLHMIPLGDEAGVQVSITSGGELRTELLVARKGMEETRLEECEEWACEVLRQLIDGLKSREWKIRKLKRTRPGHATRIRVMSRSGRYSANQYLTRTLRKSDRRSGS